MQMTLDTTELLRAQRQLLIAALKVVREPINIGRGLLQSTVTISDILRKLVYA